MSTLSPQQTAEIAAGVYRIMLRSVSELRNRGGVLGCEGMFAVDDSSRFTAKSGGLLVWKEITGFGYIAEGTGSHQGEILLATRGTQSKPDWLSNLNVGLQPGPSGLPVHAGFNEVWKSYAPEVKNFLKNRNPSVIHCVGHSLGGALAHLNADLLSAAGAAQVKLYTFGSPRSGISMFADSLSDRLGARNMYRVYHTADPVPMIPVFPFRHAPTGSASAYLVRNGNAGLVSIGAHLMPSYISGVLTLDWAGLAGVAEPPMSDSQLETWLGRTAAADGPAISGSAYALKLIGRVIRWILARTASTLVNGVGLTLTATFTVLDRLAWLLQRGAQVSKEMAENVGGLIKVIFKFLGRPLVAAAELTLAFIGWVLHMLFTFVQGIASRAFSLVGR